MPEDKVPISEFAKRIKAKYPQYADINDTLLTQKMIEKYPEYRDMVDLGEIKKKDGGVTSQNGGQVGTSVPQLDENDQVKSFLEPHREQYQLSTGRLLNQPQGGDIQGMRQPIPRTINEAKEQQHPQVTTRQEQANAAKNLDIATQVVKNSVFKNGNDAQKALGKLGNKFNPNNETHQLAKQKADEFEKVKNDVYGDGTGSIEAAALKEKLDSDPNFHQKFINLRKEGNDLSQEEKGTMITEYVAKHKNDLEELSKENQDIKDDYEDVTKNIANRLPDYGKMAIAQEITNEREKRNLNSSLVNFNTATASKHNTQIANDILTPEQKKFYDENKGEIDSKIVKGGFLNNLSNIKDLPKGTQQLVEHFTIGDNQSKGEQAYNELTPKVIDPSKGWKQVAGTLGDLTGKLAYMAIISKGLGAAGLSGGAASKLAVPLSMGNDILNESKSEFPEDETKANVSALVKMGLMTFLNPLHADKATEAVNSILSKATDGEAAATLRGKLIKGIMGAGEEVSKATAQNFTYSQAANIVDNALGFNNYHEGEGAEALKQGAIMGLIPGVLKGVSEVAKRPTETTESKEELSQPIPETKITEQPEVKADISNEAQNTLNKVNNAEYVNEKEINRTEDHLYDVLDKNHNAAHLIEPLIQKIQNYEFTTKTETRTVTEKVPTGRTAKTKIEIKPVLEQSVGSQVTIQHPDGSQAKGKLSLKSGQYTVDVPQGTQRIIGEKAITDRDLKLPTEQEMDNPVSFDENGNVKSVTVKDRNGNLITIENPEKALDIAIQIHADAVGEVPDEVFSPIYDEVKKQVQVEVPKYPEKLGTSEPVTQEKNKSSTIDDLQKQKAKLIKEIDNPPTREVTTYDKYTGKESGKEVQELSKEELKNHKEKLNKEISAIDEKINSIKKEVLDKKPKLNELPFIKAKEFASAKDSERMDELGEKHDAIKEKFINLRKISECIWAI